jgi:hypothetical protein
MNKDSEARRRYATVDTGPSSPGYFTDEVNMSKIGKRKVFFSVRDMGTSFDATVTLQFKCIGDDGWSDYDTYSSSIRKAIEGEGEHVRWRAGIKDTDYTSGTVRFGFDW